MYLKRIYLSGEPYEELQYLCSRIHGVVDVTAGKIVVAQRGGIDDPAVRFGVLVRYNPKQVDLSTIFDKVYTVIDPYALTKDQDVPKGIYYDSAEDEPQIEYYINFLNSRGREPQMNMACVTVNDTIPKGSITRKCQIQVCRMHRFQPLEEYAQYRETMPPKKSTIDYAALFAAGILDRPA